MKARTVKPWVTGLIFTVADSCSIIAAVAVSYLVAVITGGEFNPSVYAFFTLRILLITLLLYTLLGLYPGILMPLPEEIKRLCVASTTSVLIFTATFFISRSGEIYSRKFLIFLWLALLVFVPIGRTFIRERCRRFRWWGYPVIIFGNQRKNREILEDMNRHLRSGLRPVAVVRAHEEDGEMLPGVETCIINIDTEGEQGAPFSAATWTILKAKLGKLTDKYPGSIAVIAMSSFTLEEQRKLPEILSNCFYKVIIIPSASWTVRLSLRMVETGSYLALGLRHNLLDPNRLRFKRCFDLLFSGLGVLVLLPFFTIVALLIRFSSHGPAFYRQRRIGQSGKEIKVLKFRTMVNDADKKLEEFLRDNPERRKEWEETQKLKDDPRVTFIGKILRKTSLDELPQLFNVLGGSMSLVGPRPIVQNEIQKYEAAFAEYSRVRPGITGLWQVSGRSDTTYAHRVELDLYYVYNWSIWLDIYIILRTFPAVLRQSGAY